MTKVINTRKSVYRFYDYIDVCKYTDVNITVERKRYTNNKDFFYIKYDYAYSHNGLGTKGHPFIGTVYEENKDGAIIAANSMTEIMIEYLLMDAKELTKISGSVTPATYKVSIMHAITNFWD